MSKYICTCEDCSGTKHNKPMTEEEFKQDGMCSTCADNVWKELTSMDKYPWYHTDKED